MTLSVPQQMMTNVITKGTHSFGTWHSGYYSPVCLETPVIFCQRHHVLTDLGGKQLLGAHHAIHRFLLHSIFPEKQLQTHRLFKEARGCFFFLAFGDSPPSIGPQLPLKHNRCLPTRLPSTSCLVTTSPLLSTTERLTNSMSELNLEAPLIYPPHWIDRSWLHRRSLSPTAARLIFALSAVISAWNQKLPAVINSTVPLN